MCKSKLGIVVGALLCALGALPARAGWVLNRMEIPNGVNSATPRSTSGSPASPFPTVVSFVDPFGHATNASLSVGASANQGTSPDPALAYTAGVKPDGVTPAPAVVTVVVKWVPAAGEPATSIAGKSLQIRVKTYVEIRMGRNDAYSCWGMFHPFVAGDVTQSPLLIVQTTYPYGALSQKAWIDATSSFPLAAGLTEVRFPLNIGAWS